MLDRVDLLALLRRFHLPLVHKFSLLLSLLVLLLDLPGLGLHHDLLLDLLEVRLSGLLLGLVTIVDALIRLSNDLGQTGLPQLCKDVMHLGPDLFPNAILNLLLHLCVHDIPDLFSDLVLRRVLRGKLVRLIRQLLLDELAQVVHLARIHLMAVLAVSFDGLGRLGYRLNFVGRVFIFILCLLVGFRRIIVDARDCYTVDVLVDLLQRIVDTLNLFGQGLVEVLVRIRLLLGLGLRCEGGRLGCLLDLVRRVSIDGLVDLIDGVVVRSRGFDHFLMRFLDLKLLLLVGLAERLGIFRHYVIVVLVLILIRFLRIFCLFLVFLSLLFGLIGFRILIFIGVLLLRLNLFGFLLLVSLSQCGLLLGLDLLFSLLVVGSLGLAALLN